MPEDRYNTVAEARKIADAARALISPEVKHLITIDEQAGGPRDDDTAYCAFCSCGWKEDHWHHVDSEEYPLTAADEAGQDHLDEMRTS